jgi:hypothetical protein
MDVAFVLLLAAGLIYGIARSRRRSKAQELAAEAKTKQLYEEAARDERSEEVSSKD